MFSLGAGGQDLLLSEGKPVVTVAVLSPSKSTQMCMCNSSDIVSESESELGEVASVVCRSVITIPDSPVKLLVSPQYQ